MKVYLAGPFFTPDQVRVIEGLENLFSRYPEFDVYSPRKDGVLMNMSPEERKASTRKIFATNVRHVSDADLVFAVIDGRDVGTIWEIGFAYCMRHLLEEVRIVTFTNENYGLNVMIQECVGAHVHGLAEADVLLRGMCTGQLDIFDKFRDFNPKVT